MIISFLQFAECGDHKVNALPPVTTNGDMTIGFKLNGEVWVPEGGALDNKLDFVYHAGDSAYLRIGARRFGSGAKECFDIIGYNITTTGSYSLTSPPSQVYCEYLKTCEYGRVVKDFYQTGTLKSQDSIIRRVLYRERLNSPSQYNHAIHSISPKGDLT